jgi:lipoyl(octanoyl) transferase
MAPLLSFTLEVILKKETSSNSTNLKFEIRRHSVDLAWTYRQLDLYQRNLAEKIGRGIAEPTVLLSEVAPVITCGRRTPADHLLGGATTEVLSTDRGGCATYHGPGQWILFPVGPVERWVGDPRGIKNMMDLLLEIARSVGISYDSSAHVKSGPELGVWTSRGKFAAVGIHVQQGIVLHGLSINGFRTPESFQGLKPCGLDAPVDFFVGKGSGRLLQSRTSIHSSGRLDSKSDSGLLHPPRL